MRAKTIYETLEFKQGGDPYEKMSVGKYDLNYDFNNPKFDDKIELLEDLYIKQAGTPSLDTISPITLKQLHDRLYTLRKNTIYVYNEIYGKPAWDGWTDPGMITSTFVSLNQHLFKKLRN